MGKTKKQKKSKKSKTVIMTDKMIRHMRYQQGGLAVVQEIQFFSEDDIIMLTYFDTDNEKAKKLSRMYDKMLLDAKTDSKQYIEKRSDMIGQIGNYIKSNNLYREWMDLVLILLEGIQTDKILHAYMNEMMDTWRELSIDNHGNLICGMTTDGELLYVKDYFGDWDVPALRLRIQIENKLITQEEFEKRFRENLPLDKVAQDENLWAIELFDMMPFINERTKKVIPSSPPKDYSLPKWRLPGSWRGTRIYKEAITKRKFMIGNKGIKMRFKNAESVEELFLMEDIDRNNELVMVYQLKIKHIGAFTGYYRAKKQSFFSPFLRTNTPSFHKEIENFVLGVYSDVVAELDKERKRSYRIEEVLDLDNISDYVPTRIYYQFVSTERKGSNGERVSLEGSRSQRPHLRSFALRKLGDNQEASDEAKQRASEYGIDLQDGYTFVRSYEVGRKLVSHEE